MSYVKTNPIVILGFFSQDVNKAIGQITHYLSEIDRTKLEIEEKIKEKYKIDVQIIRPRGFILVGDDIEWEDKKKKSFEKIEFHSP